MILNALNISIRLLKIGGNFITKIFKGKYTEKIIKIFVNCFDKVFITKPKACRNASFESFVVCKGFKNENEIVKILRNKELNCEDVIYLNKLTLNSNENEKNSNENSNENEKNSNENEFFYDKI